MAVPIRGIHDFWRHAGGTPVQQIVVYSGTDFFQSGLDATPASLSQSVTENSIVSFEEFDDFLIISMDTTDGPFSYNGSSVSALGGSPPEFAYSA